MDKVRELRYLTPPIFFLGMLLLGAWLGQPCRLLWYLWHLRHLDGPVTVAISAALVASLFPLGFTIQGISILLQRIFAFCLPRAIDLLRLQRWWPGLSSKRQYYFACFNDKTWEAIGRAMGVEAETLRKYPAPSSIWQFEKWNKDVVDATVRLWTVFNIAAGSIVAIIAALPIGHWSLGIPWSSKWFWWSFWLVVPFALTALFTWREHMRAFEFQASRLDDEGRMPDEHKRDLAKLRIVTRARE